ncbi:MAG: hypothetical protein VX929_11930 [Pseudomonadota bacterium]|nr:hypothetical protein [Pseudomonadota bacterium]
MKLITTRFSVRNNNLHLRRRSRWRALGLLPPAGPAQRKTFEKSYGTKNMTENSPIAAHGAKSLATVFKKTGIDQRHLRTDRSSWQPIVAAQRQPIT